MKPEQPIIFVCTANICRSPMAEAIWQQRYPALACQSRGVHALIGSSADPLAQEVCRDQGTPIAAAKISQPLLKPEVLAARLILVMEREHRQHILGRMPEAAGKIWLLGEWTCGKVDDPYGLDRAAFERCYFTLIDALGSWARRLDL